MKIPFFRPDITEAEVDAVSETLRSGWITTGPKTVQFEKELAQYCGTDTFVCLNSATAAMECCLRLLGVGPGDEVITTPYTYTSSASVIVHVGATPVMVDTAEGSLEMNYDLLADAITERTKVVIPVDIAGIMCDYDRIFSILESCKDKFHPTNDLQASFGRVIVMADSAHAMGATYHGIPAGSVADFTSFSFHAVKNLTTAEGGGLTWRKNDNIDNDKLYHRAQLMSLHGQDKSALAKTKLGSWEYDIVDTAYKWNMTDIQAAIGITQLHRYPSMLARRKQMLETYRSNLDDDDVKVTLHYTDEGSSSGHLAIVRLLDLGESARNEFIVKMAERGVACNVHYKPLPMMTAYQKLGFSIMDYPHAYEYYSHEVTLPLFTLLTDEELDYIIDSFKKSHEECK